MVKCDDDCIPLCDFCRKWKRDKGPGFWGYCSSKKVRTVIYDECEEFHCYKAKEDAK